MFDLAALEAELAGTIFAGKLHFSRVTGSTNSDAVAAARLGAPHGSGQHLAWQAGAQFVHRPQSPQSLPPRPRRRSKISKLKPGLHKATLARSAPTTILTLMSSHSFQGNWKVRIAAFRSRAENR